MAYEYRKVDDLEKHELVGSHQCVALVQLYAGAPRTLSWKQGKAVLGNTLLRKGTAIATFVNGSRFIPALGKDKNGRFVSPSDNADAYFVIE
jgi:hypothetical protein